MSQPDPKPGQECVTVRAGTLFAAMLNEREKLGIATYGCTLQTFNGRDALQDALEELVDAWQYVTQAKLERDSRAGQRATHSGVVPGAVASAWTDNRSIPAAPTGVEGMVALREQVDSLQGEIAGQRAAYEVRLADLQLDHEVALMQVNELRDQVESLIQQPDRLAAQGQAQTAAREKLQEQVHLHGIGKQQVATDALAYLNDVARLQHALEESQAKVGDLSSQCEAALRETEHVKDVMGEDIRKLSQALEGTNAHITELAEELLRRDSRISQLTAAVDTKDRRIADYRRSYEGALQEITDTKIAVRDEITRQAIALKDAQTKRADLETQIRQINREKSLIAVELGQATRDKAAQERMVNGLDELARRLMHENEYLRAKSEYGNPVQFGTSQLVAEAAIANPEVDLPPDGQALRVHMGGYADSKCSDGRSVRPVEIG